MSRTNYRASRITAAMPAAALIGIYGIERIDARSAEFQQAALAF